MKRNVAIFGLAILLSASLSAENRKFGVWNLPKEMNGSVLISMDLDLNVSVAAYWHEVSKDKLVYGVVQGVIEGDVISGDFYEVGYDGKVYAGTAKLTILDAQSNIRVVFSDARGKKLSEYRASYASQGKKIDLDTFRDIKDRVEKAVKAVQ
jgi:hypothetical protein